MPSTKSHYSSKIEISRGRYGVCKYQYWKLDCLDLFVEILRNKWDDIRFIDFEEDLALAKDIKTLVPQSVLLDH